MTARTVSVIRSGWEALTPEQRNSLRELGWVALGFGVVGLAIFAVVDYGNVYGKDHWHNIYQVLNTSTLGGPGGRALNKLYQALAFRIVGIHPIAVHSAYVFLRVATALALYLLVRRLSPQEPLFAVVSGIVYLTYTVNSTYLIGAYLPLSKTGPLLTGLLALYFYFSYMDSRRVQPLILGLILALVTVFSFEGAVPSLLVLPTLVFLVQRDFRRARLAGIALWYLAVLSGTVYYALPFLGLREGTYASNIRLSFSLGQIAFNSVNWLRNAFLDPLRRGRNEILKNRLPIFVTTTAVLFVILALRSRFRDRNDSTHNSPILHYLSWLVLGIGATWLGFVAYLPTPYIAGSDRVLAFSGAGEAVAVGAFIWLVSHLAKTNSSRWLVRYLAIGFVVAFGSLRVARLQNVDYRLGATWETQAYFLRSLAHLAPSVEENTLFIYVEDTDLPEVPFVASFAFEYAIKYMYEDDAVGIFGDYNQLLLEDWEASDEGIEIKARPGYRPHVISHYSSHDWEEIVVVSKTSSGRAILLEELPPQLYTADRAALYDPYARIEGGFVSERVRELLPPVQSPYDFVCTGAFCTPDVEPDGP